MRRNCRERFAHHRRLAIPTCIMARATRVPWCMLGSLTSGFFWSRWRGKCSRHSRRMCKRQFYVSGKRSIAWCLLATEPLLELMLTVWETELSGTSFSKFFIKILILLFSKMHLKMSKISAILFRPISIGWISLCLYFIVNISGCGIGGVGCLSTTRWRSLTITMVCCHFILTSTTWPEKNGVRMWKCVKHLGFLHC